jgi:tetratricopeptide (TPR) repeat protein
MDWEVHMRRISLLMTVFLLLVSPAMAQMGKSITITAGSPEDKALAAINAETDPSRKLALLDEFVTNYGKGDMALAAYELYIAIYAGQKNYDKAFEYGDKFFALDPDGFSAALTLFRAAEEKKDVERMLAYGTQLGEIVTRYKAQPAPAGSSPEFWEEHKAETLSEARDNLNYVSVTLFNAARQQSDPRRRATMLERYATAFADSPYAQPAQAMVASYYRQAQDYAKMNEFAQKVLARDPTNVSMLLLLADDNSDRGVELPRAEQYARRALDLLSKAARPEQVAEDDWQKQKALEQGLAWTSIGQVQIQGRQDAQALESFRNAAPLLKPDAFSYARNQYRMGFALINLKRLPEARTAFTEAASVESPYRPLAQDKLKSLPTGPGRPAKKRG